MPTSIEHKPTWQDRMSDQWTVIRPMAIALVIGLIAGPLISNYMGWQVTRGFAERQSVSSAVQQQAMICAAQARVEQPVTSGLDWTARRELALKHAIMPGRTAAEADVVSACSQILAAP